MFIISRKHNDGFDTIELKDSATGTVAAIVPSLGATLHSFAVQHNNATINIIDFYDSAADFTENVTEKGFKSCKLSPFACRIRNARYSYNNHTYTIRKFLLNGSAIHGLIYDAPFDVTYESFNADYATVTLTLQYKATDSGYPFHYTCAVNYRLQKNNELVITTSVTNNDEVTIPIQDGWHPYFTFGKSINNLQLAFQSASHVLFDEDLLPNGNMAAYDAYTVLKNVDSKFFDDCFRLNFKTCQPMCVLRDPELKIQLEIKPDDSYPYLQIYTPPHRNSIALENLSAPPDSFNNGINLLHLAPGATTNFTTSYTITCLK